MNLKLRVIEKDENGLFARDIRVANYLAKGLTAREIGEKGEVSPRTVEAIVKKLLATFKCKNTAQLVAELMRRNIIK